MHWRSRQKQKQELYRKMPRSKHEIKLEISAWCKKWLQDSKFDENSSIETVTKKIIRSLFKTQKNDNLLKDLVSLKTKSISKGNVNVKVLKDKIKHFLSKIIKREYQIYQNAKDSHSCYIISDDSNDSTTKPHKTTVDRCKQDLVLSANTRGHLISGDKIAKVTDIYFSDNKDIQEHVALLQWKTRKNGFTPHPSALPLSDILYFKPRFLQDQAIFRTEDIKQKVQRLLMIPK